jgi:hypothetical protein
MSTTTATRTTQEVADRLVTLCRKGEFENAIKELYGPDVVSIEQEGGTGPARVQGFDAVLKKAEQFNNDLEAVHSSIISDPVVAGDHFAVSMDMDMTIKGRGRNRMAELAVYQVKDGKIVKDQFFYPLMPMPSGN